MMDEVSPPPSPQPVPGRVATRRVSTRKTLFDLLDAHGIVHHTMEHAPVFRVGEGAEIKAALPGLHTKNLFLEDAKGQLWLICARDDTVVDLKRTPKVIGAARLSFGSAEELMQALGVPPGSVSVFALINDPARRVRLVLDLALLASDPVNFHPLSNDATTAVSRAGLMRFLSTLGVAPQVVDFAALASGADVVASTDLRLRPDGFETI